MHSNRWICRGAVFGALAILALSATGTRGEVPSARPEGVEPPSRPGQLRGILSALNQDGRARARQGSAWLLKREYVTQLLFLGADPLGGIGGGGWFLPSQSRYGWQWLHARYDRNDDGTITLKEFGGPREWFEALDKNRDGALTQDDFDWSNDSPLVKATARVKPLFAQIDGDGSGRITPDEWRQWFDALGRGKGYLSQDDLVPLFVERGARGKGAQPPRGLDPKTRLAVACGFLSCDVGALSEGPAIGEKAPPFSLRTVDGKDRISFSALPGQPGKPLVLIFGSFT